jgi:hypothetical protein
VMSVGRTGLSVRSLIWTDMFSSGDAMGVPVPVVD